MPTGKKTSKKAKDTAKLNISLSPELAAALRKFAFEKTGQMRGVSEVAESAIREYLEKRDVTI
jgi:metal-responsive CopG/Arc/MetJ family transcriptional regulator